MCVLLLMYLYPAPVRCCPLAPCLNLPFFLCVSAYMCVSAYAYSYYLSLCVSFIMHLPLCTYKNEKESKKKRQDTDPARFKGGLTLQGQSQNGPIHKADTL